ncbi:hypothetical protein, partial [Pandoraea pnomenusa]|uniref:hypothetical protein n=1 Tax=Pandoraea pnomenusa TaxID=93220 RepID=UPI001AD2E0BD
VAATLGMRVRPVHEWVTEAQADQVKASGAMVSSCTGFGPPVFDVFNHDNKPTFRDGKPWPQGVISNEGQGREGGGRGTHEIPCVSR